MDDGISPEGCALIAQVIPVLLLVVAVGEGGWMRTAREDRTGLAKLEGAGVILAMGVGEGFAVFGAINPDGLVSDWGASVMIVSVYFLIFAVTLDLISRILRAQ